MHTLRQKAIALAIEELAMQDNSPTKHMYVYNVCRFLEVCSQHVNSAIQVVKNGGIHRLIKAIDRFYQQVRDILRSICWPGTNSILRMPSPFACRA